MYTVIFFEDKDGCNEVLTILYELKSKATSDKNSRINYQKIVAYIDMLEEKGLSLKEPFIKHIEDDIWELRPLKNRIFFAAYKDGQFIILTYFLKKSQKTPHKEIDRAKKTYKEFLNGDQQ